jgi:hypothetical protein
MHELIVGNVFYATLIVCHLDVFLRFVFQVI